MLAKVGSGATVGLSGVLVDVEVDVSSRGLPSFTVVGLPDKAVEESKDRVRSAIKNSGADFPTSRITVNLAPADLPKAGPAYDLPIALGILIASGQISPDISNSLFLGELSLDGSVRHTNGVLPISYLAREKGYSCVFVPYANSNEASVMDGIDVYPVCSLTELVRHFTKKCSVQKVATAGISNMLLASTSEFDFSEIIGQESAKRALEIAAVGGHNIFMKGTPGSGKTMLARAFPGILPKLTVEEALELTKIYSITGSLPRGESLITSRPFRSPHHTTSRIGLIGGGSVPLPGEVSYAHRGVLFLDEFPEFPRHVIESLRQPLEDGVITISRAKGSITYPAKFVLIAASNPCPCGYFGDIKKNCSCMPGTIARYQKRISGPILDRIDIHVEVPAVDTQKLVGKVKKSEPSESVRQRVQKARDLQTKRFLGTKVTCNSEMQSREVKKYCKLDNKCLEVLNHAVSNMSLSARGYYKVVKIARTIADLEGASDITQSHVAESLQYRIIEN